MDLFELSNLCCRHNIRLSIEPGDGLYDCRFRMSKNGYHVVQIVSGFEITNSKISGSQILRDIVVKMFGQLGVKIDE